MEFDFCSFVLENLDASGGLGGYVSLSIVGFALISFIIKKKLKNGLKPLKFKWTHSAIGSLMGAIPGCGATIVVASLYKKGDPKNLENACFRVEGLQFLRKSRGSKKDT